MRDLREKKEKKSGREGERKRKLIVKREGIGERETEVSDRREKKEKKSGINYIKLQKSFYFVSVEILIKVNNIIYRRKNQTLKKISKNIKYQNISRKIKFFYLQRFFLIERNKVIFRNIFKKFMMTTVNTIKNDICELKHH